MSRVILPLFCILFLSSCANYYKKLLLSPYSDAKDLEKGRQIILKTLDRACFAPDSKRCDFVEFTKSGEPKYRPALLEELDMDMWDYRVTISRTLATEKLRKEMVDILAEEFNASQVASFPSSKQTCNNRIPGASECWWVKKHYLLLMGNGYSVMEVRFYENAHPRESSREYFSIGMILHNYNWLNDQYIARKKVDVLGKKYDTKSYRGDKKWLAGHGDLRITPNSSAYMHIYKNYVNLVASKHKQSAENRSESAAGARAFDENQRKYGLGRYAEKIDIEADLQAMRQRHTYSAFKQSIGAGSNAEKQRIQAIQKSNYDHEKAEKERQKAMENYMKSFSLPSNAIQKREVDYSFKTAGSSVNSATAKASRSGTGSSSASDKSTDSSKSGSASGIAAVAGQSKSSNGPTTNKRKISKATGEPLFSMMDSKAPFGTIAFETGKESVEPIWFFNGYRGIRIGATCNQVDAGANFSIVFQNTTGSEAKFFAMVRFRDTHETLNSFPVEQTLGPGAKSKARKILVKGVKCKHDNLLLEMQARTVSYKVDFPMNIKPNL